MKLRSLLFACAALAPLALFAGHAEILQTSAGLQLGKNADQSIGFHGATPSVQVTSADQAELINNTGGSVADSTLADGLTIAALTVSTGGSVSTTLAAATNIDTLTGTLTGTLDNSLADLTAATAAEVTGSLTGTTDGALADIADIALSTSNTYTDAAVNSAVNAAILSANLQIKELQVALNEVIADNAARLLVANKNLKEIQAELVTQRALNTVFINSITSLGTTVNLGVTDITTQNTNDAKIAELANALRAALVTKGLITGS